MRLPFLLLSMIQSAGLFSVDGLCVLAMDLPNTCQELVEDLLWVVGCSFLYIIVRV